MISTAEETIAIPRSWVTENLLLGLSLGATICAVCSLR